MVTKSTQLLSVFVSFFSNASKQWVEATIFLLSFKSSSHLFLVSVKGTFSYSFVQCTLKVIATVQELHC